MAASSRLTSTGGVIADCPRCGRPLPPIPFVVTSGLRGQRVLNLEVTPRLDAEWWAAARKEHGRCLPPGAGGESLG